MMRTIRFYILLAPALCIALAAVVLLPAAARSQTPNFWEYAGGMYSKSFSTVACNARGHIYAANGADIWRTKDKGGTWDELFSPVPGVACLRLAFGPEGILYAGTSNRGVWRSADEGATWTHSTLDSARVQSIAVAPGGTAFADSSSAAVCRSVDGGLTWRQVLNVANITSIRADAGGAVWAATVSGGVYRSTDDGLTWTLRGKPSSNISAFAAAPGGKLFAISTDIPFLFRSLDYGFSWERFWISGSGFNIPKEIEADSTGRIFIGVRANLHSDGGGGLYYSTNDGASWTFINDGLALEWPGGTESWNTLVNTIAFAPGGDVVIGTSQTGIYWSHGGYSWKKIDKSLPVCPTPQYTHYPPVFIPDRICALSDNEVIAAVAGAGVFHSTDSGRWWAQQNDGLPGANVDILKMNARGAVFAVLNGKGIYRMYRGGTNWQAASPPFASAGMLSLACAENGTVYAASSTDRLFRSIDDGRTWTPVSDAPSLHRFTALAVKSDSVLYANAYGSDTLAADTLYVSSDGGRQWSVAGVVPVQRPIPPRRIVPSPDGTIYMLVDENYFDIPLWGGHLLLSTDGGATWDYSGDPFGDVDTRSVIVDAEGNVIAYTAYRVRYSRDRGHTWTEAPHGPYDARDLSLSPGGVLYATSADGAYRTSFLNLTSLRPTAWADTLERDHRTGDYARNPIAVHLAIENTGVRNLESVRAALSIDTGDGAVVGMNEQVLAAQLDTGQTTSAASWNVRITPGLTKKSVRIVYRYSADGLPERNGELSIAIPPALSAAMSGSLATDPAARLPYDSLAGDYQGTVSPFSGRRCFTVRAVVRSSGEGPGLGTQVQLQLPGGLAIDLPDSPARTLPAVISPGDSAVCSWRCRADGFAKDTVLYIAANVTGTNFPHVLLSASLLLEAAKPLPEISCLADIDTLVVDERTGMYTDNRFTIGLRVANRGLLPMDSVTATISCLYDSLVTILDPPRVFVASRLTAADSPVTVSWRCETLMHGLMPHLSWFDIIVEWNRGDTQTCMRAIYFPRNRRADLQCMLSATDTLRYDPVKKDYEGEQSAHGNCTVFPLILRVANMWIFTARMLIAGLLPDAELSVDTVESAQMDSLTSGDWRDVRYLLRARSDTVWRAVTLHGFAAAANADSCTCRFNLIIEPFPGGTSSITPPAASAFLLRAHPNPATDHARIQFRTDTQDVLVLELRDLLGRKVRAVYVGTPGPGLQEAEADLRSLVPGVYFLLLRSGTSSSTLPLVVR